MVTNFRLLDIICSKSFVIFQFDLSGLESRRVGGLGEENREARRAWSRLRWKSNLW